MGSFLSNGGSKRLPSRILSRTAWRFSPKLQDKMRDEKPGFEATGGGCMLARVLAKQSIYTYSYI